MKNTAIRPQLRSLAGFAASLLFFAAYAQPAALEPPERIAGMGLAHALRGKDALREIDRLHGKGLASVQAYVAHYEQDGRVAMLYVSRPVRASATRTQIDKMAAGIGSGKTPFFHLKSQERGGRTVYSALGEGQIHYFFTRGAEIVWLAADPDIARQALESVLGPGS